MFKLKTNIKCPKCGSYRVFPVKGFGNKEYGIRNCAKCGINFDPITGHIQTKLTEVFK